jgi:phenylalanyl-tRNA synthetase alpha chain
MSVLPPAALARDLAIPDLTAPVAAHSIGLLVDTITAALAAAWPTTRVETVRTHPIVSTDDNYDRLGFAPDAVTRDARYSRYVSETCLLRTHTSAIVPPALRRLASADATVDVLFACPGVVFRRDAIDRLHTGTPHQLDLWRISTANAIALDDDALAAMIRIVIGAALPGLEHRCVPADHPYTEHGLQIDVLVDDAWIEVGECGLAAPPVLARAGLPVPPTTGLAMGLGLDRLVMVRKGIDDIRLLRSTDPRVVAQLRDLSPYRPVSNHPPIRRDVSIAVGDDVGDEDLGDAVREGLAGDADCVESVAILSTTPLDALPPAAVERLGIREGQRNVLLRIVLRHVDRTLTDAEANVLRDRIYAAVHHGR